MEYHKKSLSRLCRRCKSVLPSTSKGLAPSRVSVPVSDYREKIKYAFGICTDADIPDIHPIQLCRNCMRKCDHARRDPQRRLKYLTEDKPEWYKHPRNGPCATCQKLRSNKGGNCKRNRYAHLHKRLPFLLKEDNIFKHLNQTLTSKLIKSVDELAISPNLQMLYKCEMCNNILHNPVYTPCQHSFCAECLTTQFQEHRSDIINCLTCDTLIKYEEVTCLPHQLLVHYRNLELKCKTCSKTYLLHSKNVHVCTPNPVFTSPTTTANILTTLAMTHPSSKPVPEPVITAVGAWVGLMLAKKKMIELKSKPTAKKRFTLAKIIKANKVKVSAKQKRRRTSALDRINQKIQSRSTPVQKTPATLSRKTTLAMIADANLTNDQTRKIARYVRKGIRIAPEGKTQTKRMKLLPSLTCKMTTAKVVSSTSESVHGYTTKEVPIAYISNIPDYVEDYLNRLDKEGMLTWHDGQIPADEVWIKVGGDHGGGSFKMSFHVCNLAKPNAPCNTICSLVFEARDVRENLEKLTPVLTEQLQKLQDMTWRGKKMVLWAYGDLDFLGKMYGICSCNARYACIKCTATKDNFKAGQRGQERTTDSMDQNFKKYVEDGSRKERSKEISQSIIARPLLPIPVNHVAVSSLHVWMGVFQKVFDMFVKEVHKLDQCAFLGKVQTSEQADLGENLFDEHIKEEQDRVEKLKKTLEAKEEMLWDLLEDIPLRYLQQRARPPKHLRAVVTLYNNTQIEVDQLKAELNSGALPFGKGHLVNNINETLNKCGVRRQAYHGGAFNGNDVRKMLISNKSYLDALTQSPYNLIVEEYADDIPIRLRDKMTATANKLHEDFNGAFYLLQVVQNLTAHSQPICEEQHNEIELAIQEFFEYYRQTFPDASITLKMHILEFHVLDQIKLTGFGLGLLSEQGGELLHRRLNTLKYTTRHIQPPEARVGSTLKKYLTKCMPEVISHVRQPKKRKAKQTEQ